MIIGGGVVGASVLYHLARSGWTDVLLVEKSELTSGSTWHAAGGMHTFNGEANISRLQKYTIDLYREIEELSGQSCGLHPNGGLMLAATQGELDSLKLICSRARYLGMETEMITLDEAVELNPLIDQRHFIGALWRADGGHCDPSGTTHAYVKAARKLGASVERFTRVLELNPRADGTWDVVTDKGTVHAEHVVNCAGLWAREVGQMVGVELPVLAMEHHYLLTDDIPELQGRSQEIVNTTDYAGEIYLRQERGGALIGTYEPHGKVWSPVKTPDDFSMQLLPDEFERLAPYFEVGFEHFPALGRAGIRKAINGPFTFAPDGNPLVGPVRGLRNYWVACAVMAGFSQGGGIGLVLSRWMAEGDPGQDILSMDVARFGRFATPKYTSIKVPENYSRRFRLAYPNEELPAARPVRRSPIYDRLLAAGAVMGANFGLEHALWFAPPGVAPTETPTYRRSEAFPIVREECRAVRRTAGLYETSNYGKYEVTGRGARAWLDKVFACRIPQPGRLGLAPMLNPAGRIVGDLSIACLAEDRYLIVGSGFAEEFHLRWFWTCEPPADVFVRSAASTLCGFSLAGPNSREILQRLVRKDLCRRRLQVLRRHRDRGRLRAVDRDARRLYRRTRLRDLDDAGLLRVAVRRLARGRAGRRGLDAVRRSRAVVAAARKELRFVQQGLPARLHARRDRPRSFRRFRQAGIHRARGGAGRTRATDRSVASSCMEVEAQDADVVGYESIMKDGKAVGYVTSGAYGHCVERSLAAGYVPTALARDGERFEIDILGHLCAATVRLQPLYDPEGLRLRG